MRRLCVTLAAVVAGCVGADVDPAGRPCSAVDPCGPGTVCSGGICVTGGTQDLGRHDAPGGSDSVRDAAPGSEGPPGRDLVGPDLLALDLFRPDVFVAPDGGCPPGFTRCGSICADLSSDLEHCGGCGNACSLQTSNACVNGTCVCGNTGKACPANSTCHNGACCSGCVSGGKCYPGTSPTKCGNGGTSCSTCSTSNPCQEPDCSSGACKIVNRPAGSACDDGKLCTDGETCENGVCGGGSPHTCPGDPCNKGVCDPNLDACVKVPVSGTCDDGKWCTSNDSCQNGVCTGDLMDCSALDDDCNVGACSEFSKACEKTPRYMGHPCPGGACLKGACCTGCIDSFASVCAPGKTNKLCGTGGAFCQQCSFMLDCINGKCVF